MKNLRMKLVAAFAAMICCVALYTTVVAQDEFEVIDDGVVGAKDGHGHWHGSIFHCTGTPVDCSNP